jgi:hypothetical protein
MHGVTRLLDRVGTGDCHAADPLPLNLEVKP